MHVSDMISFWARTRPHQPAIIQPDTIVTYRALDDAINSVAHRLGELKLDPNDAVAVAIENPAKQLAVAFGLLRSGFTTAPIFPGLMAHLRGAEINNVIYEGESRSFPAVKISASRIPGCSIRLRRAFSARLALTTRPT